MNIPIPINGNGAAQVNRATAIAAALIEHQIGGALMVAHLTGLRLTGQMVFENQRFRVTLEERPIIAPTPGDMPPGPLVQG